MRELGKLYKEGERVTVIGRYNGFPSDVNVNNPKSVPRLLINQIKVFDENVSARRKPNRLYGTHLADHLCIEAGALQDFIEAIHYPHSDSLILFTGTVEMYGRTLMGRYTGQDAGLTDVEVDYWICRRKPDYLVFSKNNTGCIPEIDVGFKGKTWQECIEKILSEPGEKGL